MSADTRVPTDDAPPIPDGDPDEWTRSERITLYEYVADLDISEDVSVYLTGLAETLRRRDAE